MTNNYFGYHKLYDFLIIQFLLLFDVHVIYFSIFFPFNLLVFFHFSFSSFIYLSWGLMPCCASRFMAHLIWAKSLKFVISLSKHCFGSKGKKDAKKSWFLAFQARKMDLVKTRSCPDFLPVPQQPLKVSDKYPKVNICTCHA